LSARSSLFLCILGLYVFQGQGDGIVEIRVICNILGVYIEGKKDVLGLYTAETDVLNSGFRC
jgi:hypothetical protein